MIPVLPRVTLLAQHGAALVSTIDHADPTHGAVPFRQTGDVVVALSQYPPINTKWQRIDIEGFHRYAYVDQLASFEDDQTSEKALAETEKAMRANPAPGVVVLGGVGRDEQYGDVSVDNFKGYVHLGHVFSHWDEVSRSIINRTAEDHRYRWGIVIRQAALVKRSIYMTTLGEGINVPQDGLFESSSVQAWKNGNMGYHGFLRSDLRLHRLLAKLDGYLS